MILVIAWAVVTITLILCIGLLYHALEMALEEREMWYTPLPPISFDHLEAEEEDDGGC